MSENGVHPPIGGFVPRARTVEVVCDWIDPADGAEPLTATLAANLTWGEIGYLSGLLARLNDGLTNAEVWTAIAPRILSWNAVAYDMATGEYAPVPSPAEAGNDAFRSVDAMVTPWLLYALTRLHLGGDDRPKESTPAASSANGSAGDNSAATAPNGTSRSRSRTGSKKPSPVT
jgi:hypothetical protein